MIHQSDVIPLRTGIFESFSGGASMVPNSGSTVTEDMPRARAATSEVQICPEISGGDRSRARCVNSECALLSVWEILEQLRLK